MRASLVWIPRIVLAGVFLYAGIVKLGTSERFTITVAQFTLLPPAWIVPFALTLPWVEMLAGILLLVPRTARFGAAMAAAMLAAFLVALGWAWSQGLATDCGCFGEDAPATGGQIPAAFFRDCALFALTMWALRPPGQTRRRS